MTERNPLLQLGSLQSRLPELVAKKGAPPWSEAVVLTDDIQAFLICQEQTAEWKIKWLERTRDNSRSCLSSERTREDTEGHEDRAGQHKSSTRHRVPSLTPSLW